MAQSDLPVLGFADAGAWESWLALQHASSPGVWLKIAKKGSGATGVSYPDALEAALCYGWIDGQKGALDGEYWLQRFTPRKPGSRWSKINTEKAAEPQPHRWNIDAVRREAILGVNPAKQTASRARRVVSHSRSLRAYARYFGGAGSSSARWNRSRRGRSEATPRSDATVAPAARPAATPGTESSTTRHREISTSSACAATR